MKLLQVDLEELDVSYGAKHCAELARRMAVAAVLREADYHVLDAIEITAKMQPELYKWFMSGTRLNCTWENCHIAEFEPHDIISHITATEITEAELAALKKFGVTCVEISGCEWFESIREGLVTPEMLHDAEEAGELD